MQLPLQISFHNMPHSAAVEDAVRENAARLDEFCGRVMSCRVVIDQPHRHHRDGNLYQVRIDITAPGEEIVINREQRQDTACKDLEAAIGDAFDVAVRRVRDYVRRQRRDTKAHEPALHARVVHLVPKAGYGFLRTPDDREIYFHQHSVVSGDFEDLEIGMEVAFAEELGDKGPQATTVRVVGRRHQL
jgi:cold shock CspA family protein/ribosome-associated translation inhibitor RaiA